MANQRQLKPHHYRAMELRLHGLSIKDIAEELGYSWRTVEKWFYANPAFRREWQRIQEERIERARNLLVQVAPEAARTIASLARDADSETVRLGAAKDVLDRVGLGATQKHEHSGPGGGPIQTAMALLPQEEVERRLQELGVVDGSGGDG